MRHMEGVILLSRLQHSLGVIHHKERFQFYHVYFRLFETSKLLVVRSLINSRVTFMCEKYLHDRDR